MNDVFADLATETELVDRMVAALDERQWALETPAPGWTIAKQVAHLSFVFRLAGLAASDPDTFTALTSNIDDFNAAVNGALEGYPLDSPAELLARWRQESAEAVRALTDLPEGAIVPWLVRPLPAAVLACAGMMELFAHGQDIADTLRIRPERTDRIGHLVIFATLTWDFGYLSRGLPTPPVQLRYEITAPSGEVWEYGPADSAERVTGPAVDFALLVTRRRHRADLAVTATGAEADRWLDIAQAYRGPAGEGRAPGQFDHLKTLAG
ncbi:TIGR03084 family metal-binding protein [Actinomadura sp. 7K534]|uniref:TIGR03084 family metal-binding protein n=1 Tax=Actinomadura sp. 7K534 TaxID=2530366 RepID=UPI0010488FBC|nr:TIGR03084 family metal-binding protein [Actinomadura sp. 7K534]TDB98890.1 TIGR03084 family protein [Actinomadura sp. 7K534]